MVDTIRVSAIEVERGLTAIGVDAHDLQALNTRIAGQVAPIYASHSPRKTGRMAGSTRGVGQRMRAVVTLGNDTDIPYAAVVTFGWPAHNIEPNRWDKAATAVAGPQAVALYAAEFNRIIARHGAGP